MGVPDPRDALPLRRPPAIREDPDPGILRALLHGLYDVAWVLFAVLASPWLVWKSLSRRGFGVRERLGRGLDDLPRATRPRVLVHGVSVGEVMAARAIVALFAERHPEFEVVLSCTTNTGLGLARKLFPTNVVVRFPADMSWTVRSFLHAVDPFLVILVELEVWPNFLRVCNREGRAVAVVNGRITRASYGWYRVFRRSLPEFNRISLFCAQSEEYAGRFGRLGIDPARVCVTGNVKFDGLHGPVAPGDELARFVAPRSGQQVLVAGSTHDPEELLVARAARRAARGARLVLVPRHPARCDELVARMRAEGIETQRLTELRAGGKRVDPELPLIVDTIGDLQRVYALADLVFVGGSLVEHGGQNVLEPAAQGKAVLFGPHVENFRDETALLLEERACVRVADEVELERELARLLADADERERMGRSGMLAVAARRGATRLTLDALEALDLPALAARGSPG